MSETLSTIGKMIGEDIKELRNSKIAESTANERFIRNDTSSGTQTIKTNLEVNGDLEAKSVTETSARKFKKDITEITGAMNLINGLTGVSYKWKNNDEPDIGFIAEDFQKVVPELVKTDNSGEVIGINYSKVTALLVNAVKELQLEIQGLKEYKRMHLR